MKGVIFDTSIRIQAALSRDGQAHRLLSLAREGRIDVVTSSKQLYEPQQMLEHLPSF